MPRCVLLLLEFYVSLYNLCVLQLVKRRFSSSHLWVIWKEKEIERETLVRDIVSNAERKYLSSSRHRFGFLLASCDAREAMTNLHRKTGFGNNKKPWNEPACVLWQNRARTSGECDARHTKVMRFHLCFYEKLDSTDRAINEVIFFCSRGDPRKTPYR